VAATLTDSQVIEPDAAFMTELRQRLAEFHSQWVAEAGTKRSVDGAAAMQFFREQVAGYRR